MHVSDVGRRTCFGKGIRHMIRLLLQGRTPKRFGRYRRTRYRGQQLGGGNPVFNFSFFSKTLHLPSVSDMVNFFRGFYAIIFLS